MAIGSTTAAIIGGLISMAGSNAQAGFQSIAQKEAARKQNELERKQANLQSQAQAFSDEMGRRELIRGQKQFARERDIADIKNKMTQEDLAKQKRDTRTKLVQDAVSSARAKPIERLGRTQRSLLRLQGDV